jgi:hypothetical protein
MTALPSVHETLVVLIELARIECTSTVPVQRSDTGTPAAIEAGAHSAAAQARTRSRGRMAPDLSPSATAQTHPLSS